MSSSPTAILQVRNLRVRFGKLVAVDDVSLDLHAGDLLGLIGPNGAGKTTLLRAIACLQPAEGDVLILGEKLRPGATELMRQIGLTPDSPPVYEDLTVRQFLQFVARGYDISGSEINERIDFWLEKVWLTEKADQKIKQLSRGMRQRIGIARTLLPNSAVILLDEPAAGLDPAGRVQFRQLLCSLRDQGKVLIVSSHILSDMEEYCTHIGIMSAGRMVQYGTVRQIASHEDGARCRYTVTLAEPVVALANLLAAIEGTSNIQVNHESFTLEYSADRKHAAELLAALMERRLPIASFTANAPDLEEAYLRAGIRQVD
ncbi:MAG TPA: ABC transporter ATP-binding protein [Tepidisphaeraceae bacterium]|jgi:ABC-2 type transport system ATP-binding protein